MIPYKVKLYIDKVLNKKIKTKKIYSHWKIWAEEKASLGNNTTEWSFGDGSTGYIGLPIAENDAEVVSLSFHADVFPKGASVSINLIDIQNRASVSATVISTITINNETDGGGYLNNTHKTVRFNPPIPVPDGAVLGFRTTKRKGKIKDARVVATIRSNGVSI